VTDPYQPPQAEVEDLGRGPENTRARFIGHESRCLGLGWLAIGLATLAGLALVSDSLHGRRPWDETLGYLAFAVAPPLAVGVGILQLREWARLAAAPLFFLLLFLFPIGTFLGGYALWVLFSEPGGVVFSLSYRGVKEQTPTLRASRAPSLAMVLAAAAIGTVSLLI
jgi:hypothetical protein